MGTIQQHFYSKSTFMVLIIDKFQYKNGSIYLHIQSNWCINIILHR